MIVKYSMPNCGNCQKLSNILKLNNIVVEEMELTNEIAQDLNIMSVPVMIKFVNGKEVDRITGLVPVSKIKDFCNE